MCDSIQSNTAPSKFRCKPGHGTPNNTDAICTPNVAKAPTSVLHNSNQINDNGAPFDNCCNKVVNPAKVTEPSNSTSAKCNN